MKRFLYVILGGLFVSLFIVLSGSSFASAASIYDDVMQTTDKLIVHNDANSCTPVDVSTNFRSYFFDDEIEWYFTSNTVRDSIRDTLSSTLDNDGARVFYTTQGSFGLESRIIYTPTTGTNLNWGESSVSAQGYHLGLVQGLSGGCDITIYVYNRTNPTQYNAFSTASDEAKAFIVYNYNLNLPPDYEGIIPPEAAPGLSEPYVVDPAYEWNVTADGILNISIIPESTEHFMTGWSLIKVHKTDDNWANLEPPFYDEGYPPAGWLGREPLNIQLPEDGYYTVIIGHDGYLDSPPWPERDEGYFVLPKMIQIRFKNGVALSGTTLDCGGGICNDFRDSKSPYKYLNALGIPLFGLQEIILAPLAFLSNLQDSTCRPLSLPLPRSMGTITMPCMTPIYRNNFNAILIIYQTILVALFAYYVSIRSFNTIKDVANPRNDQIETVNL